jgi:outer membrane biosynthesis protein TonB
MTRSALALRTATIVLAFAATAAQARIYPFPADAPKAELRVVGNGQVTLNGKLYSLSPAAQIRDPNDRLLLTQSMQGKYVVRVKLDGDGNVIRAWVLSPEEAKAK